MGDTIGVSDEDGRQPAADEVLATYLRLKQAVAERAASAAPSARWDGKAALAGFLELLRVLSKSGRLTDKEAAQIQTSILRELPQDGTVDPSHAEVVFAVQATVGPLIRASSDRLRPPEKPLGG
jgi:hypothetical protein